MRPRPMTQRCCTPLRNRSQRFPQAMSASSSPSSCRHPQHFPCSGYPENFPSLPSHSSQDRRTYKNSTTLHFPCCSLCPSPGSPYPLHMTQPPLLKHSFPPNSAPERMMQSIGNKLSVTESQ